MKYATPEAFRAALDQRLRKEAEQAGVSVMRVRKRVAFERFLARLVVTAPDRWMLKGALALDLRFGLRTRATKDIDLASPHGEDEATAHLRAAQAVELGDFFTFQVRRTPALDAAAGFRAVRFSVVAEIAGRRFEQFPVDVALGEELVIGADLLGFAGIEAAEVPVVALEQHIAEKVHAYTATYGVAGSHSTRPKDLVDLVLIKDLASPAARTLQAALRTTFEVRARQPLPGALPKPPGSWAGPYARLAAEVGLSRELADGHAEAVAFLDPVLAGDASGRWAPRQASWTGSA
jgi:predicted nucleotidyltransferase component of viral defense system